MRRVLIALALLALVPVVLWWALYRDHTSPEPLDAQSFVGKSLSQSAATIAESAVASGVPGALILLQLGDEQVIATAGVADKKSREPIPALAPLRVASISKIYTGAVLVDLALQGLVDLDAPISTYLADEVIDGLPNGETATVRQLLNHSAGIPDYYDFQHYFFEDWTTALTLERTLPPAKRQKAPFPAGEGWEYSNMGYILAGAIAEQVTGRSLAALIDEVITEPLALSSTYYGVHQPEGSILHGYGTFLRPWADTFVFWEHSGPDAGVVASAADVAAMLNALVLEDDGPLTDLGAAMLDKPYVVGGPNSRSQGFESRQSRSGLRLIGHTGDVMGYLSFAYAIPDDDAVIVGHITCDCPDVLATMIGNTLRAVETHSSD